MPAITTTQKDGKDSHRIIETVFINICICTDLSSNVMVTDTMAPSRYVPECPLHADVSPVTPVTPVPCGAAKR